MTTPKAKLAGLALIAALCAGFTLGMTAPAWAGWDEGVAAYQRGDYATALREWRPLAEQGDAKAQFNLGIMYSNGQGVPQDYAEALQWLRKAAEQGQTRAQFNLGVMYRNGLGVGKDPAEAALWFGFKLGAACHVLDLQVYPRCASSMSGSIAVLSPRKDLSFSNRRCASIGLAR